MNRVLSKKTEKEAATNQRQRSEASALTIAIGAALGAFLLSWVTFQEQVSLFGRDSVGYRAAMIVAFVSFAVFFVASRDRVIVAKKAAPSKSWRRLRQTTERASLSLVYCMTAFLFTVGIFYTFSSGFVGLMLDPVPAAVFVALSAAIASYVIYLLARSLTTVQLSGVLGLFLLSGALTSMITSSDPYWWEYHFSFLGTESGVAAYAFNGTLILAGLAIVAMSNFIREDFYSIQEKRTDFKEVRANIIGGVLALIGVALACVGLFPFNLHPQIHDFSAQIMAVLFGGLVLGLPWLAPAFSKTFFVFSYLLAGVIVLSLWLYMGQGYFNLTAFELICAAIVFGWIIVFIRQIAAYKEEQV